MIDFGSITTLFPGYSTFSGGMTLVYPSDRAAVQAIAGLLETTGEFDRVSYGRRFDLSKVTTDHGRIAHIQWPESATEPDGSTTRDFHMARYVLTLATQDARPDDEIIDELDRLANVARNLLLLDSNKKYGGFCIARYSRLTKGTPDLTASPISTIRLQGQYAFSVDLTTGYLATG